LFSTVLSTFWGAALYAIGIDFCFGTYKLVILISLEGRGNIFF